MGTDDQENGLAAGTPLAHYVVRRPIGTGAMGTVYEAHDTALDRTVALKVIRADLSGDASVSERFTREARAAARATHANLTHIYFVGSAGGRAFYAMELVPGENLEARVLRDGPLELDEAVDVLVEAARGLEAAHAAGVVHRDVKPSNLLLAPGGGVKVTDFGLAKSLKGDARATQAGTILGTPTYMSPEQCRGGDVDARTDVYALGLTAWFLLAGRPPFRGESVGDVLADQLRAPLPSLASVRERLPPGVDAALARLCAKDASARPASMASVVAVLESLRPRPIRPAPFATRAAALAIDVLVFAVVSGALAFAALQGLQRLEGLAGEVFEWTVGLVVVAAALFLQPWMERRFGASIGKMALGTRVVREDGLPASAGALLARFLLCWPVAPALALPDAYFQVRALRLALVGLQLLALLLRAGFWPFAGRRTLSDVVTRTRVVYAEAPEPGNALNPRAKRPKDRPEGPSSSRTAS